MHAFLIYIHTYIYRKGARHRLGQVAFLAAYPTYLLRYLRTWISIYLLP